MHTSLGTGSILECRLLLFGATLDILTLPSIGIAITHHHMLINDISVLEVVRRGSIGHPDNIRHLLHVVISATHRIRGVHRVARHILLVHVHVARGPGAT